MVSFNLGATYLFSVIRDSMSTSVYGNNVKIFWGLEKLSFIHIFKNEHTTNVKMVVVLYTLPEFILQNYFTIVETSEKNVVIFSKIFISQI